MYTHFWPTLYHDARSTQRQIYLSEQCKVSHLLYNVTVSLPAQFEHSYASQVPADCAAEPQWQDDKFVFPLYVYSHGREMRYTNNSLAKRQEQRVISAAHI